MPQNINLNIPPYNDDFDANKNYYKVLFKPTDPIQSRELTTLQSILQNQIEKFGQHFFKDGSVVIPGNIGIDLQYSCVEINPVHLGIPVTEYLNNLVGVLIKGERSNVIAKVENVITDSISERDNCTIYVKYQSSSQTDFTTDKFISGENLVVLSDVSYNLGTIRQNNTFATTISSNSTSIGSAALLNAGIYFVRGYFVNVPSQKLILEQYNNTPTFRVGLLIKEFFASASNEYSDLYDNAQGFSNFAAPGADRLVIECELIKKEIDDFNDENFIELASVEEGVVKKIVKNSEYGYIMDELARRTYDESGDYYVKPYDVEIKESLNDYLGNNGIYSQDQKTMDGNAPSSGLACISVSPGKAYVKGYSVETISNTLLDIEKARTTNTAESQSIQFNFGNVLELNNVYGTIPVGFGTETYVGLRNSRTSTVGIFSGSEIGVARVYDLKLKSAEYTGPSSKYEISLYDIQTYTELVVSSSTPTISTSSYIEGKNSGAVGYIVSTNGDTLTLHQVSGSFVKNEQIIVNGIADNRIIKSVTDYSINDIKQVVSYNSGISTFTADTVLSRELSISNSNSFSITASSGGISTITTPTNFNTSIKVGDIVSYYIPNNNVPTYNKVQSISGDYKKLQIVGISSSVSGVNSASLPASQLDFITNLVKVVPNVINVNQGGLYSPLNNINVSKIDVSKSVIVVRKSFNVNLTSTNFETSVLESNPNYKLEPFDEEKYNLSYTDGTIVSLNSQNLIPNSSTGRVTLRNLPKTGNAILTVTYRKVNCKTRKKIFERCSSITIDKTNSGINTVNTGLVYSSVFGTRIEDSIISLNCPDVVEVLGIYESFDQNSPTLPTITLNNLSSSITNAIVGESVIGANSKTVASIVSYTAPNIIQVVYRNNNKFEVNEEVKFEESSLTANVQSFTVGDKNISSNYSFDSGSRSSYLDFSRIIRTPQCEAPKKKIKIIFNRYTIDNADDGTFVGVNSYDLERYGKDIESIDNNKGSDVIDFRPRVANYTLTSFSPFDFRSRNFNHSFNSSPDIAVRDESFIISYDYYLPRIDKLYLSKEGNFILSSGVPSTSPKIPSAVDQAIEIATLYVPAYVYDVKDIKLSLNDYKRYTMKDISNLETRLSNVEYYTSLSLLELETKNLVIRDPDTKLDKFKSGFFVDNFSTVDGGDLENPSYRVSVDLENNKLKPTFTENTIELVYDETNSTNVDVSRNSNSRGSVNQLFLPYTDFEFIKNVHATRVENINPFNIITGVNDNWVGSIILEPSTDTWMEPNIIGPQIVGNLTVRDKIINKIPNFLSNVWAYWVTDWLRRTSHSKKCKKTRTHNSNINLKTLLPRLKLPADPNLLDDITSITESGVIGNVEIPNSPARNAFIMRTRNIGVKADRLKSSTRFYAFFDNINVTEFIVPKLLEVSMISGTFSAGETIIGTSGSKTIRFKLAAQNHKYGPILQPTEVYTSNPYSPSSTISSNYSTTTEILNVDVDTLQLRTESSFYGCVLADMELTGTTSGAKAKVKPIRLVTDTSGVFIGSFHIPDPTNSNNPQFQTGEKIFTLTSSPTNDRTPASIAESSFISSGTIDDVQQFVLSSRIKRKVSKTDPIAQSFTVRADGSPGVFVTKCDIYFQSKEVAQTNIPVTLEIRTMQDGVPTITVLAESVLYPANINVSQDASVPSTFSFEAPVYLQTDTSYSLVLTSHSSSYNVWISRMGETVISNNNSNASKIIASQINNVGSVFKSRDGVTWDQSQLENFKFTLYRANFNVDQVGIAKFYNPILGVGNRAVTPLAVSQSGTINPITAYSKSLQLQLNSNLNVSVVPGQSVTQTGNSTFTSSLSKTLGTVGIGSTLSIVNPGSGFTSGTTVYSNVDLISKTGSGSGAKINLSVSNGVAIAATVSLGGNGYSSGDILTIDYSGVNNFGKDLLITIPSTVGIISSTNSILLENVQGDLTLGSGDIIINGITATGIYPTNQTTISGKDGLHFKVYQPNHGMYSDSNLVEITGIESDVPSNKLIEILNTNSTEIKLQSVQNFVTFEGKTVGIGTTGYVLIDTEIIGYESVNLGTNSLGNITSNRGVDNSLVSTHTVNTPVYKYEFNGVSLRKINKVHSLLDVNQSLYPSPIELDSYHININTNDGVYFKETKTGGVQDTAPVVGVYNGPMATKNIMYNVLTPVDPKVVNFNSTSISSKIRTFTATSVSGSEASFIDNGYEDISLDSNNIFSTPRAIYSRVNELEYLNGPDKKSLYLDIYLKTNDPKLSPVINLDRVSFTTASYRLNDPIDDFTLDGRVNKLDGDPCAAIYVSRIVKLENEADSLKVLFDAYRHESNDIRVAYRVFRNDTPDAEQLYELFPGYGNINERGETIDTSKSNGLPDRLVTPSGNRNEFKPYEYTVNLPYSFTGFQIKIMMTGTNQAIAPELQGLRVIATI